MLILLFTLACRDNGFVKYNASPEVLITSHDDNTNVEIGSGQEFVAEVNDLDHSFGDLTVYWEIDNEIVCPALPPDISGQSFCNVIIEEGHERVKVTVQDPNNDIGIDSLNLVLTENNPPSLTYVAPTENQNYHSDIAIQFALFG